MKNYSLKLTLLILTLFSNQLVAEEWSLNSPDGQIEIKILATKNIHYQVYHKNQALTKNSPLSITLEDGRVLGNNVKVLSAQNNSIDENISVKGGIRSNIRNQFNELTLTIQGGYKIIFRAFDNGVAYRFTTNFKQPYVVMNEWVEYKFPEDVKTNAHIINTYRSSFEKQFTSSMLTDLSQKNDLISIPVMIEHPKGPSILLSESDQKGYPGLLFKRYSEENIYSLKADFAPYPKTTKIGGIKNFNVLVDDVEPFIAKRNGNSKFPWRVMIVEENSRDLVDNTLVYQLAEKTKIETSWIKYGRVAWDWYNALNLDGVTFKTGVNTETYKYYIDFASRNNLEYIILDEGWSDQFDIRVLNEEIDLKGLIEYGKSKGVGIILWSLWYPLEADMDGLFKWVKELGAVGLKIDFFDRNDQVVMEAIEKILKKAAENELLIDFHGCPTLGGMERTYPNLVTYESVKGNEFVKWDPEGEPPSHNVSLAFTRNVVGPMDYTPGAMKNATQEGFSPNFSSPMSKSTRAHQVAMYPVYFSPLQMLCDAPTAYEKEPEILNFIASIPSTWDETVVLDGVYPEFIIVARKKGDAWYVGGLNNQIERTITVDLSFLGTGTYKANILSDGINANKNAEDFKIDTKSKTSSDSVTVIMSQGGGFAITFKK